MLQTILIPSMLSRYSDDQLECEVEAETVGEAFEALFERFPDLRIRVLDKKGQIPPYLIVLQASDELPRDAFTDLPLKKGQVLTIVPGVEGGSGESDVRMRGFKERDSVEKAREVALAKVRQELEEVTVEDARGRVLAEDVSSLVDVPAFDRAAMDGFALRAEDSFGATLYDPVSFKIAGEVFPGARDLPSLAAGEACRIMTGAPIPPGADCVLKAEDAREANGRVEVQAPVTPKKNVGRRGEDIQSGEVLLRRGRRLRPQDVGLLSSIGHSPVSVVRKPRVAILVSGNELLPPGSKPDGHRIVDSNSPMLRALIEDDGGEIRRIWRLGDEKEAIRRALETEDLDVVVCAGGSSVGREDYLPVIVRELGELPIHGVAMRPSSPTGIGSIGERQVFLLPGNPVSCLCAYDFFVAPALRLASGLGPEMPHRTEKRTLSRRIASAIGRLDYVRVLANEDGRIEPLALTGASILSSTTRALGFVIVPEDSEGLGEGQPVTVYLYDGRGTV